MNLQRSKTRKPTHPGAILREDVLPALRKLGITQTEFAKHLGVSRRTISEILHERRSVTPDIAVRLAHFLGTTPASWLNMQNTLDVWNLEKHYRIIYARIEKQGEVVHRYMRN